MAKGNIKFFNNEKCFGFIERQGEVDIFVHKSAVEKSGFKTELMLAGASVEFIAGDRDGRPCVTEIISIEGGKPTQKPQGRTDKGRRDAPPARRRESNKRRLEVGATGVGEVVSFKDDKGFGFMRVIGNDVEDVFFHVNDIPADVCREDPEVGDKFHFRIADHNGKTKAKVTDRYDANKPFVAGKSGKPAVDKPKPASGNRRPGSSGPKSNPVKGATRQDGLKAAGGLKVGSKR